METIKPADELTTPELVAFLESANQAYRSGTPIIDDDTYDHVYPAELRKRDPEHPFLNQVEPEDDFGTGKVKHEHPMLSTEKAYTADDMAAFVKRVEAAAKELGIEPTSLRYRITPKLDGMAGRYSNDRLVTRGNGEVGNDVTHVFDRGVQSIGGTNTGLGEIVLLTSAWENGLSDKFAHPRNVVVGLVGADSINDDVAEALEAGAVHFASYASLPARIVTAEELLSSSLNSICDQLETGCGYPTLDIGTGCKISLTRSGLVIPKLLGIHEKGATAVIPYCCPACDYELSWERDFLVCANTLCSAQIANRLSHFFSTIGNIDLFGDKTIATLLNHGVDELPDIYGLTEKDFQSMGFGPKQAQNLVRELKRSLKDPIEDWRFLASFGIRHLGRGDSRRLLTNYSLSELPSLTAEDIQALDSFGPLKAPRIASELRSTWPLIETMISLGFKLTGARRTTTSGSPIAGLNIVFTGKMDTPRKALQDQALLLGANPQSSVSGNTDILVIGENVGAKKIEAAQKHNTRVIVEKEYLEMIAVAQEAESDQTLEDAPACEPAVDDEDQLELFA